MNDTRTAKTDSDAHPPTGGRWLSVVRAAEYLDLTPSALRRTLERRARRGEDGTVEAVLDGVRARKLGRLWRVQLSAAWRDGGLREGRGGATLAGSRDPAE